MLRTSDSLVKSLERQIYSDWELVCVCSEEAFSVRDAIASARMRDARIHFVTAEREEAGARPLGISLAAASGDIGVVLDATSRLRRHALLLLAHALNENPAAALVYADEDRLDANDRRRDHWFKPDWNPALLLSTNYVGGLAAFRIGRARASWLSQPVPADEAWDLLLRLTRDTEPSQIVHLPHVLVHRRLVGPAAGSPDVVAAHLASSGVDATVEPVGTIGVRVVYRLPRVVPRVRLIVATGCLHDSVGPCLESVLRQTDYSDFALSIVIDEKTQREPAACDVLQRLASDPRVSLMAYPSR